MENIDLLDAVVRSVSLLGRGRMGDCVMVSIVAELVRSYTYNFWKLFDLPQLLRGADR
jgi:hypothetical protein